MMPGTLYETHVQTTQLETAIAFYKKLELKLAHIIEERRVAFFWFGEDKSQMLGVWEVSPDMFKRSHFAFKVGYEEIIHATSWLQERGINPVPSFGLEPTEPIVHTWMPSATVYFSDPDGNSLEFLHILPDNPSGSNGTIYLSEWQGSYSRG